MRGRRERRSLVAATALGVIALVAVLAPGSSATTTRTQHASLHVTKSGTGTGLIVGRAPVGDGIETPINCGVQCVASVTDVTDPKYQPVTLRAIPDPGSVFKGWSGSCSGIEPLCTIDGIGRLLNYYADARFDLAPAPSYPVTVALSGAGSVSSAPAGIDCGAVCGASFATGSTVTLTATPRSGWSLAGWDGACTGAGPCTLTIDGPKSVTATFAPPSYQVSVAVAGSGTVVSAPGGIACGAECSGSFKSGSTVTLTAQAAAGAGFVGWGGGCSGAAPTCELTLSTALAVTASFTGATGVPLAVATIGEGSVSSAPAGIACGRSCAAVLPGGSRVTLTARPAPGERFLGWGQDCRGSATTCVVTLSAARAVTAAFVDRPASQPLAVTTSGKGRVTSTPVGIDCGKKCAFAPATGSIVTLTAIPAPRNGFVRWTGSCSGKLMVCKLRMTGPRSVTALFAPLADQVAPLVRALPSSGVAGSTVRLRYRATDGSGKSREWAEVFDGARRIGSVKGVLDEADPDALFNFLAWRAPGSVPSGRYTFCVWAADPSGNVSRRSCSTLRLT